MPHGQADPYLVNVRSALAGQKSAPLPFPGFSGLTYNHAGALIAGAYGIDPVDGPDRPDFVKPLPRARALAFLAMEKTVGHCAAGGNVPELGGQIGLRVEGLSTSHAAHDLAWAGALLLFALRNGDAEMLGAVTAWIAGEMAFYNLCAVPHQAHPAIRDHVVVAGARCWIGPAPTPQNPAGGGDADQRQQMASFRLFLRGEPFHASPVLDTADDLLGLYCLTLIDEAFHKGEAWAAPWPALRSMLGNAGPELLPVTYQPLQIERSASGFVIQQLGVTGQGRPALWALANFKTGEESYGCLPTWPRDYRPKMGEIPTPKCPGGPGTIYRTKSIQPAA